MAREYKLKVDSAQLVKAFEKFPGEVDNLLRKQIKMAVRDIKEYAAENHRYTSRSGALEDRGIITSVWDNMGFLGLTSNVPYGPIVHEGIKTPYTIVPRRQGPKKALRWTSGTGRGTHYVYAKRVRHPAIPPDPFLYNAADHEMPKIQTRLDAALEKLFKRL